MPIDIDRDIDASDSRGNHDDGDRERFPPPVLDEDLSGPHREGDNPMEASQDYAGDAWRNDLPEIDGA